MIATMCHSDHTLSSLKVTVRGEVSLKSWALDTRPAVDGLGVAISFTISSCSRSL